ncbi:hypothetical protein [Oleiharenicola sp. Vm1]|uniref:hypothetical protein n=1 Tax=Oleiharenicola sp. Vm1 TaxID=3398393 RepID=UPI0039F60860
MKKPRSSKNAPPAPAAPASKVLRWAVAVTCVAAIVLLMRLARDILAQIEAQGGTGGAGTLRLLTGLFVVMCLAGFVAAGLWKVGRSLLDRDDKR